MTHLSALALAAGRRWLPAALLLVLPACGQQRLAQLEAAQRQQAREVARLRAELAERDEQVAQLEECVDDLESAVYEDDSVAYDDDARPTLL